MNSAVRFAAVSIVLVAMMLRALVPVGWMPDSSAAHAAVLTICTVDGVHRVVLDPGPSHKSPAHNGAVCPFAATAHYTPPPHLVHRLPRFAEIESAGHTSSAAPNPAPVLDWTRAPRAPPLFS